jgi:hypothetical protein
VIIPPPPSVIPLFKNFPVQVKLKSQRFLHKHFLVAVVGYKDGTSKTIISPFQASKYRGIGVTLEDLNRDGIYDAVNFFARLGTRRIKRRILLH